MEKQHMQRVLNILIALGHVFSPLNLPNIYGILLVFGGERSVPELCAHSFFWEEYIVEVLVVVYCSQQGLVREPFAAMVDPSSYIHGLLRCAHQMSMILFKLMAGYFC